MEAELRHMTILVGGATGQLTASCSSPGCRWRGGVASEASQSLVIEK